MKHKNLERRHNQNNIKIFGWFLNLSVHNQAVKGFDLSVGDIPFPSRPLVFAPVCLTQANRMSLVTIHLSKRIPNAFNKKVIFHSQKHYWGRQRWVMSEGASVDRRCLGLLSLQSHHNCTIPDGLASILSIHPRKAVQAPLGQCGRCGVKSPITFTPVTQFLWNTKN